jgi:hypothetical protein
MRFFLYITGLSFIFLIGCAKQQNPQKALSGDDYSKIHNFMLRYAFDAPKNTSSEDRFDAQHDSYYQKFSKHFEWSKYADASDGWIYFEWRRRAPSFGDKWVATGGRLKLEGGRVVSYQEIFRTWKMDISLLNERSALLFEQMIKGESLERFWSENAKSIDFIEFPNALTHFNLATQRWEVIQP